MKVKTSGRVKDLHGIAMPTRHGIDAAGDRVTDVKNITIKQEVRVKNPRVFTRKKKPQASASSLFLGYGFREE